MPETTLYCPVCDRTKTAASYDLALDAVKTHVTKNHPDYDPQWANDTIRENE